VSSPTPLSPLCRGSLMRFFFLVPQKCQIPLFFMNEPPYMVPSSQYSLSFFSPAPKPRATSFFHPPIRRTQVPPPPLIENLLPSFLLPSFFPEKAAIPPSSLFSHGNPKDIDILPPPSSTPVQASANPLRPYHSVPLIALLSGFFFFLNHRFAPHLFPSFFPLKKVVYP